METGPMTTETPAGEGERLPWGAGEILLVALLSAVVPGGVQVLLEQGGWFAWYYGPEWEPRGTGQLRAGLWSTCLAFPLLLALTLALLRSACGVRPADLGLTARGFGRQAAAGLLVAAIFTPGAYAINWLATAGLRLLDQPVQDHPFTRLGRQGLLPGEWALVVAAAVVVAPVWEELLYRGLVQPWVVVRQPLGGLAALGLSLLLAVAHHGDAMRSAAPHGAKAFLVASLPALTLTGLAAVYLLLARKDAETAGIFAAAVLFGWVHVRVWPSPVPLVWLAVGLGWLAWRGKSLVGPMVTHAIFNGVACLQLLAG